MFRSELDHLVVACTRLEEGVDWIERQFGVRPQPGGQHVAMGTHNALLKLGPRAYLEVIAIDPDGAPPARPRWFALDEPGMQARLAAGPSLVTWVLRCESLANACARVPDLGEILSMARGDFHWKIAVPDDGSLPWGGVLPAAIQWEPGSDGESMHPCDRLPDSGCELESLRLAHPAAVLGTAGLVAMFRELRVVGPIDLKPGPVQISASIRGPAGRVTL
jgi:Glyoxalase-like domain